MRRFLLLLWTIAGPVAMVFAQDSARLWNAGLHGFVAGYAPAPWQRPTLLERPLSGLQLCVNRAAGGWMVLGGQLQLAPKQQVKVSAAGTVVLGMFDLSLVAGLSMANGQMLSSTAKLRPVLATGLGGNFTGGSLYGYVPLATGFQVNLTGNIIIEMKYSYKFYFDSKFTQHQVLSFGFNSTIHRSKQRKQPPHTPLPDADHDGIADVYDDCPYLSGPREHHGCPGLVLMPQPEPTGRSVEPARDGLAPESRLSSPVWGVAPDSVEAIRQQDQNQLDRLASLITYGPETIEVESRFTLMLKEIPEILDRNPGCVLKIAGHTDDSGNSRQNLITSVKRAHAMKLFLVESLNVPIDRIVYEGHSTLSPRGDNTTEAGRMQNRRVEFLLNCP